jgi:hypothetical protein
METRASCTRESSVCVRHCNASSSDIVIPQKVVQPYRGRARVSDASPGCATVIVLQRRITWIARRPASASIRGPSDQRLWPSMTPSSLPATAAATFAAVETACRFAAALVAGEDVAVARFATSRVRASSACFASVAACCRRRTRSRSYSARLAAYTDHLEGRRDLVEARIRHLTARVLVGVRLLGPRTEARLERVVRMKRPTPIAAS